MSLEDDIINGTVFGEKGPVEEKIKTSKVAPKAKTMLEATAHLKNLDAKKKKSKSGTFAKGTHGSGAAKMREQYKENKRNRGTQKKK